MGELLTQPSFSEFVDWLQSLKCHRSREYIYILIGLKMVLRKCSLQCSFWCFSLVLPLVGDGDGHWSKFCDAGVGHGMA